MGSKSFQLVFLIVLVVILVSGSTLQAKNSTTVCETDADCESICPPACKSCTCEKPSWCLCHLLESSTTESFLHHKR